MLAAQFRLSDAKKINSAAGMINKPTTNIYFLFFGMQNHLILHGKRSGLGNFSPTIFLVSSGIRQVCDGKTAWKKHIDIVGSFNGTTTTCKLMTRIFFSQLRNNRRVSCLRNAIKFKTTLSRDS